MCRRFIARGLFFAAVMLGLFVFPTVLSAQGNSEWAFERVKAVQETHTQALMAKPGVVGTAIGSDEGDRPVVLVLVERGDVPGIPANLEGIPVRPLVTGEINALAKGTAKPDKPGKPGGEDPPTDPIDPTARFDRPVPIGVSTGNIGSESSGTIGCRVTAGGKFYALSNNHVYALLNAASPGSQVLQPGRYDDNEDYNNNVIGTLAAYARISFSEDNTIDAALAECLPNALGQGTPADGYGIPRIEPVAARVRMEVMKYGRTTGQTTGKVKAINATVNVGYGSGTARFVGQIVIAGRGFSAPGDSGSLIVSDSREPVGLLFAGSELTTIANPIQTVLDKFDATIDGE
ncbi:MAG: S1 family peptidase [Phycisphaerae bacterium]|nr:S1 family peptidase [Phycisphaerae bacterium]